ncbi:MAG: tetratricopeptide repeat protein [Ferruginibacter sp.]|nr:tetratricopeptide repeat protein [Ferruginibacter sp.]
MVKLILQTLAVLMIIISCNNQDHAKKREEAADEINTSRENILKDSILKFPDSLLFKEKLIQYYRDSDEYDKAIAIANEAIKKDSITARLWDIKANLHFENEDTANAINAFETAFKLDPSPRYLLLLGSLYAQTRNNRALIIADALINTKLPETEKEALFIKGLYYSYTGDKKTAISFFNKCLNLDNRHMFAYREKGIALYDMGKYEDAIAVLDKAVTLQNNFDEGYYWLGRCLEKLNKPNDAIEEYKTALLYSPDYIEAKDALARLGIK